MRSTYPDYFEKQKTTDTLPYSTREAHFAVCLFWSAVVEIFAMYWADK